MFYNAGSPSVERRLSDASSERRYRSFLTRHILKQRKKVGHNRVLPGSVAVSYRRHEREKAEQVRVERVDE